MLIMVRILVAFTVWVNAMQGAPQQRDVAAKGDLAPKLKQLREEWGQAEEEAEKAERVAASADDAARIEEKFRHKTREFAGQFFGLARNHPKDASASQALVWIVENDGAGAFAGAAVEILLREHSGEDSTLQLGRSAVFGPINPAAEQLLRGMLRIAADGEQGLKWRAWLAAFLARKADLVRSLKSEAPHGKLARHFDPQVVSALCVADPEVMTLETQRLLAECSAGKARVATFAKRVSVELDQFAVGKTAPEIVGADIDDRPMRLSDLRGKVVVLKFWATWCGPCMAMVPHDRELVTRHAQKPFALVGVESDRDKEEARRLSRTKSINWRSWWDGSSDQGPIAKAWNVAGLWGWPTIYVIDGRGVIRYKSLRARALDDAVDFLLAEAKRGP